MQAGLPYQDTSSQYRIDEQYFHETPGMFKTL
jgi:hypothetical protein